MLNVIKVDIENDYQVMSMAVTRLNNPLDRGVSKILLENNKTK